MAQDQEPKKWPIDDRSGRINSLRQKPVRFAGGAPSVGKNGAKPVVMPGGRIATTPITIRNAKPMRYYNGQPD